MVQNSSSNGIGSGSTSSKGPNVMYTAEQQEKLRDSIFNAMYSRSTFIQRLLDPKRDIDEECGYPKVSPEPEVYKDLYDRISVAARVVELFPRACWKVQPEVYESEKSKRVTPFELAWDGLGRRLRGERSWYKGKKGSPIWECLKRIDVLSGIGRYGVLFIGLDDGRELRDPAEPRKGQQVTMLRCFPEVFARVNSFESRRNNPRNGHPLSYNITFANPTQTALLSTGQQSYTEQVHWTRVVHIADGIESNEFFGKERLWSVLPEIMDLRKIYGACGEGYWKSAFSGLSLETHPQLGGDVRINRPQLEQMTEDYFMGLQRQMILMGMSAKTLAPTVVDPMSHIKARLEAICIKLQCPMRIFMGAERGELASSQDESDWDDTTTERQNNYNTPRQVIPLVDRLIWLGCLPEPGEGYVCDWPDVSKQSATTKATVFAQRMGAMTQYVGGGVSQILPEREMLTREAGYSEEEAEAILQQATDQQGEGTDEGFDFEDPFGEGGSEGEDPFQPSRSSDAFAPSLNQTIANCGGEGGAYGPCPQHVNGPLLGRIAGKLSALADRIPVVGRIKAGVQAGMKKIHGKLEQRYGTKAATAIMTSGSIGGYGVAAAAFALTGTPGIPVVNDLISIAAHTAVAEVGLQLGRLGKRLGLHNYKITDNASFDDLVAETAQELQLLIDSLGDQYGEQLSAEIEADPEALAMVEDLVNSYNYGAEEDENESWDEDELDNAFCKTGEWNLENCGGPGSGIPGPCPSPADMQAKIASVLSSDDPDRFAKVAKMASDYDKATKQEARAGKQKEPEPQGEDSPALAAAKESLTSLRDDIERTFDEIPLAADPTGEQTTKKYEGRRAEVEATVAALSGKETLALAKHLGVVRTPKTRAEANQAITRKVFEQVDARKGVMY